MSHIKAYTCDCCNVIKHEDEVVGVSLEQDLFDTMLSYKAIMNPAKAFAHHCLSCYEMYVLNPARVTVNRKKDETAYTAKLKELQYNLRKITVLGFNKKKHK
jgi:hypothetical protein